MNSSKKHFKEKECVTSSRMGTAGSLEPGPTERPRHRVHKKHKHCSGTLGSGSGSGSDESRPRDPCKHSRDLGAQKGSSRLPDHVEDRSGSRHGRENGQTEPKRKREKRDEASEAANGSKASSGGGSSLSIKDTNKLQAQLGLGLLQVMAAQEKAAEIQDSRSQRGQGSRRESSELRWGSDSEEELHRRKYKKYRTSERDHGSPRKSGAKFWESSLSHSGSELKRGHKRRHDCTSPTSGSSTSPFSQSPQEGLDKKLSLLEQQRLKKEKKQQKLLRKAFETSEEKRARRLAKKEAKERKKREKMGWGEECMGYTDTNNPFGDNNLLRTFVWHKALEKKGFSHLEEKELKERNKRIQEENRLELQKVKQLCLEREREKAKQQQELESLQREKEAEHFKPWQEQEDNFHLQQSKLRSQIRIRDGRAKPIDLLATYINAEDNDLAVEIHEPYNFLNGLTVSDLEDLLEDIQVYMELEQGKNEDFWRDMTIIAEDEISKLHKLEASEKGEGKHREAVNASVSSDVQLVFKGKTYNQLWEIFQGIESKIQRGGPNLDIGFWESVLQQLKVHMARSRLREDHQDVLQKTLLSTPYWSSWYKLLFPILNKEPKEQGHLTPQARPSTSGTSEEPEAEVKARAEGKGEWEEEAVPMEEDLIHQSLEDYDAGKYSPRLLTTQELPSDAHVTGSEEDVQCLLLSRQQLQGTGDANESAEDKFLSQAKEGMGADESQFSVEMPLTGKAYLWADKYRPRKPRFFNRVHTGFEWNKYNRTHYDFDNPPPKIVQGYKFNIFYPDLIDKRSTPKYSLEACQDKDFAILYFHAGPPYEDIAFKIINREWEYSQRHGFRCQFVNGIFQLWFHFKRYRYRR